MREDLNRRAPRVLAVLRPLKVIIENLPEGAGRAARGGEQPRGSGGRARGTIPFTREIYIEQDDFREDPPKKYFRLSPGKEVRLRYGYIIKCVGVDKAADGTITALRCTYDPDSKGTARGHQARAGDDPLGVGGARPPGRGAALRSPVHERAAGRRRHRLPDRDQPERARGAAATASSSRASPAPRRRRASSSSASATSSSIATRRPIAWSSTARSRCATSGRRSTRAEGVARFDGEDATACGSGGPRSASGRLAAAMPERRDRLAAQATSRPSRAGRSTAASRRAAAACSRSGRGDTCRG